MKHLKASDKKKKKSEYITWTEPVYRLKIPYFVLDWYFCDECGGRKWGSTNLVWRKKGIWKTGEVKRRRKMNEFEQLFQTAFLVDINRMFKDPKLAVTYGTPTTE